MNDCELLAVVNAWPTPEARPPWPREEWQATAESIIRETILQCFGKPRWYLLRLLLHRVPFRADQPEFKTIWYQEHRRQLSSSDELSDPALAGDGAVDEEPEAIAEPVQQTERHSPRRPVRLVLQPEQWADACHQIIQTAIADFPRWREPSAGAVNYRTVEFLQELRFRDPVSREDDDIPPEFAERVDEWRDECQRFRHVWFGKCAELMGLRLPDYRAEPVRQVKPAPKPRDKQRTLF